MSKNKHLNSAKKAKDDEFYTLLSDIENEMKHYTSDFIGKHVHMPCDHYLKSNFWKYFYENFDALGLRKISAMHFQRDGSKSRLVEYDGTAVQITNLAGDGSFMSDEGVAAICACDIVVTNPPFSLWRAFYDVVSRSGRQFVIVGTLNAFYTKEAQGDCFSGRLSPGKGGRLSKFYRPDGSIVDMGNTSFYTNIRPFSHASNFKFSVAYDPSLHKRYDDFDAINCNRSAFIPEDYFGNIGVPVSFFLKLDPTQFELVNFISPRINGRDIFERMIIRRRDQPK